MPGKYTLDKLAWFNRCLFPGDFEKEMMAYGVDRGMAFVVSGFLKRNPHKGIIGVYQEWIGDKEFVAIIDQMVYDFIYDDQAWRKKKNDWADLNDLQNG